MTNATIGMDGPDGALEPAERGRGPNYCRLRGRGAAGEEKCMCPRSRIVKPGHQISSATTAMMVVIYA